MLFPPVERGVAVIRPVKVQFNSRMGSEPIHGDDSGGLFGQITRVKEAIQHLCHVLNIPEVALLHDGVLLPERRPR